MQKKSFSLLSLVFTMVLCSCESLSSHQGTLPGGTLPPPLELRRQIPETIIKHSYRETTPQNPPKPRPLKVPKELINHNKNREDA